MAAKVRDEFYQLVKAHINKQRIPSGRIDDSDITRFIQQVERTYSKSSQLTTQDFDAIKRKLRQPHATQFDYQKGKTLKLK